MCRILLLGFAEHVRLLISSGNVASVLSKAWFLVIDNLLNMLQDLKFWLHICFSKDNCFRWPGLHRSYFNYFSFFDAVEYCFCLNLGRKGSFGRWLGSHWHGFPLWIGGALKPSDVKPLWVHVTCAWFSPEVSFSSDEAMEPAVGILKIPMKSFLQVKC